MSRVVRFLLAAVFLLPAADAFARVAIHPDLEAQLRAQGAYDAVVRQLAEARARGAYDDGWSPDGPRFKSEPGKVTTWNAIVILVDFADNPAHGAYQADDFQDMLFGDGTWPSGSMREHYLESSYGDFVMTGDVVGWYRMPQPYSYYCNTDGVAGTSDDHGFGTYPNNAQKLYEDAVAAADPDVDFNDYTNGGATVEGVFVVHAGVGAETTGNASHVWSHRSSGTVATDDRVDCVSYTHQPERQGGGMATMGVYAHEFGHTLGLPDLYDTDDSSSGIGRWCMMAGGSWNGGGATPAHFSAWCKRWLGWVTPTSIPEDTFGLTLTPSTTGPVLTRIKGSNMTANEYFLLEVRRKTGFDSALPGSGLLVWHIDGAMGTNSAESCGPGGNHPLVRLIQADGLCELENGFGTGDADDPFPGGYNTTRIGALTNPSTRAYNGKKSGVVLENIVKVGHDVTLDILKSESLLFRVPTEYPSLEDAVTVAGDADEIRLQAGHAETGQWVVSEGVRISGGWDATYTSQDDQAPSPVAGDSVLKPVFDITGGAAPVELDNLVVSGGLGLHVFQPFESWRGGALHMSGGSLVVTRTRFTGNQAGPNNLLPSLGGALALQNVDAVLEDCVIDGNSAQEGAAIHLSGGSLTLRRTRLDSNPLLLPPQGFPQRGGAILVESGTVVDEDGEYLGHAAHHGGALLAEGASISLTRSRFEGNQSSGDGGAVHLTQSDLTVDGARFVANHATGSGGAVHVADGTLDWRRGWVEANTADALGGGLYVTQPGPGSRVGSSVFTLNQAQVIVGGLFVTGGEVTVEHNTFHANTGAVATGALQTTGTTTWVRHNVFSQNVGGAYTVSGGGLQQLDANLWWQNGIDVQGGSPGPSSVTAEPHFVDVAGGDFHLGPGSRAIDAGLPTAPVDFDGSLPDLGAYGGVDDQADRPAALASATWQAQGPDAQLDWAFSGAGTAEAQTHVFAELLAGVGKQSLFLGGPALAVVPAPTLTWTHAPTGGESYQLQPVDADGRAGAYSALLNPPPTGAPLPGLRFWVGSATPNPFNPTTRVEFSLPRAGMVTAEVLDVRGRRVRVLLRTTLSEGRHQVSWDGRDDSGAGVASGAYVFRLRTDGAEQTRRLLLVK